MPLMPIAELLLRSHLQPMLIQLCSTCLFHMSVLHSADGDAAHGKRDRQEKV